MRCSIRSSDLSVRMESGREEEEEEFMGLDQNNSQIIIPRELIRNLNMTRGGSIRNLNMTRGGSRVYVYSICHAFATCMLTFSYVRAITSEFLACPLSLSVQVGSYLYNNMSGLLPASLDSNGSAALIFQLQLL